MKTADQLAALFLAARKLFSLGPTSVAGVLPLCDSQLIEGCRASGCLTATSLTCQTLQNPLFLRVLCLLPQRLPTTLSVDWECVSSPFPSACSTRQPRNSSTSITRSRVLVLPLIRLGGY